MSDDPLKAVPPESRARARAALRAAFGGAPVGMITPVSGGISGALPFRVEVGGRHYLLRLEGPPSPLRNPHQYLSMQIAAEAGIAPKLHHVDAEARVAIMDFVMERPLAEFPGGATGLARAVGEMLARLQATAAFPRFVEYPDLVGRLWDWVCSTGLFGPGVLDPYTEHLLRIRESYVWDPAESVSSHNDPVPRNILFDGGRLWLIDWESAYRNDPLVDIAITLDNLAASPELEAALLSASLGRLPRSDMLYRLDRVRGLVRLYYAGVLLSASAAAFGPIGDGTVAAPTLPAFRRDIQAGRLRPGEPETQHVMGKMLLASFLTGAPPPGLGVAP